MYILEPFSYFDLAKTYHVRPAIYFLLDGLRQYSKGYKFRSFGSLEQGSFT